MKKIIFFITHKTLDIYHADLCFKSLANQKNTNTKFDKLYIYNSHEEDINNDDIIALYNKYNLKHFISEIEIYDYNTNTPKTLGGDVFEIRKYFRTNYNDDDKILLLKSDILLSVNFFNEIEKTDNLKDVYFTAPFILAKKRISDDEIFSYLSRDIFINSDDITFFSENKERNNDNDFYNRKVGITDEQIKFVACTVIRDFSCHYISNNLLDLITIRSQSWGGVNLSSLYNYHIETDRCFVVHKYHDIISENRNTNREGPVTGWLLS